LTSRWQRALDGDGQVALIIGEAGIGKSRLVQRFHEQIADTPHTWIGAGAGVFFQNTPFYPVVEMLRQFLGDGPLEDQIAQLESRLELAGLRLADAIPLIAPLLNLPLPAEYSPLALSPEQRRRLLLATLVEWVLGSARAQPLIIATEDLHWVDPSTLELIQLLVEQGPTASLLLLYTARPEFHAPWPMRAHHTQITLNRLGVHDVRAMVAQVAAAKALADDTVATVVERTGGIPLFVEELTRAVLESVDAKLTGREIPATLHDSLMARLDRLRSAKEIIQIGAVIGNEFSYELLHAVHPIGEGELQAALHKLTDAELLYVRGIAPEATYQFKHALIRDAAYEALLKTQRKNLHRFIARTIDEQFAQLKEAHPEVLARHWTEAGEIEAAIAQWSTAGKMAEARNAFREALESYQQSVALLNLLPESPEREIRELNLRSSLYLMLFVTRGPTAPETIDASARVAPLAEKSGNVALLQGSVISRSYTAYFSGDLRAAAMLVDYALELALRAGRPAALGTAYMMGILTRIQLGDLAAAEKNFAAGLAFFDDPGFRRLPGGAVLVTFGAASSNAWLLGRPDVARERSAQMIAAVDQNNPFYVALSAYMGAGHSLVMREYEQARVLATRSIELCEKHQFGHFIPASCQCILGEAVAQLGRATEGIELIRQGIARSLETGSPLDVSRWRGGLAVAQDRAGATVDALATVEQALQANPYQLLRRPENLRVRGELRLKEGQNELAEADFRESITLAQKMGAKALELRSTMNFARLLDEQNRRDEARTMLADIYNWFTEGFDTADLKDAKALLDELGG
jgi:tetratricopeptide (TPR) repeat protein